MEDLEYIVKKALIECDQGVAPAFFKPTFNTKTKIHGCLVATKKDFVPLTNIPSFKICKITQKPCIPVTTSWLYPWSKKIDGQKTLVGRCISKCSVGGTIKFITSGQIPLPKEAADALKNQQDKAQEELIDSGNSDSVGEAGFAEGMIPVWGSGRDLVNAVQTGDGWGMAMNAAFLAWDVGSIVAGVFSFGTGTAAMQAGKAGLKGAIKAGGKRIAKKTVQKLGELSTRYLSKQGIKELLLKAGCKIKVVLGCFTGDTLIHTVDGLKPIKDIIIGDIVLSYDNENGKITHRSVVSLFRVEVTEILEVETEKGVIQTTPNHPFYVNGEYRDAEQLNIGDILLSCSEESVRIISLNYIIKNIMTYSFEVEEDHCYFVGIDGVLVLNACRSNYREFFLRAYKSARKMASKVKIEVHHRIPQEWFKKGVFKGDANTLSNLVDLEKKFHKEISKDWTQFRKYYKKVEKRLPTQAEVYKKAKEIDKKIEEYLRKRGF